MSNSEIKEFKVKKLPKNLQPSSLYYVKVNPDKFKIYLTDSKCPPTAYSLDAGGSAKIITSPDGSIQVVETATETQIQIEASLLAKINLALQAGDNVSELVNDAGYITIVDIPEFKQDNSVRKLIINLEDLPEDFGTQDIIDYILALPEEERTIAETDSKWNIIVEGGENTIFLIYELQNVGKGIIEELDEYENLLELYDREDFNFYPSNYDLEEFANNGSDPYAHQSELYTDEKAQAAVGNILTDTVTIHFTYDDSGNIISAEVKPNSITATELANNINISEFVNNVGYELTLNKSDSYTASSSTTYASTNALVGGLGTKVDKSNTEGARLDPSITPIYAWGDSLTEGSGFTPYPTALSTVTGFAVTNKGVGGETSTQIKDRMIADTGNYSKSVILWVGRNNFTDGTAVKTDLATMISALGHTRYLVLGILNGNGENAGTTNWTFITNLNNDLKNIYGDKYVDIRDYLVSQYNPLIPQDVIDFGNDITPSSLRSDGIHLNDSGYAKVADYVNKKLGVLFNQTQYIQSKDLAYYTKLFQKFEATPAYLPIVINENTLGNSYLHQSAGSILPSVPDNVAFGTASNYFGNLFFRTAFIDYIQTPAIDVSNIRISATGFLNLKNNAYTIDLARLYDNGHLILGGTTDNGYLFEANGSVKVGSISIGSVPATSTGGYDILTRNTSTGDVEKISGGAGTYTPTLTNDTNITSSSATNATYTKTDNIVNVSVGVNITPTSLSTNTILKIPLPENRATTGTINIGVCNLRAGTEGISGIVISTSTSEVTVIFTSSSAPAVHSGTIHFQYSILD